MMKFILIFLLLTFSGKESVYCMQNIKFNIEYNQDQENEDSAGNKKCYSSDSSCLSKTVLGSGASILTALTIAGGLELNRLGSVGLPLVITLGSLAALLWIFFAVEVKRTGF